VVREKGSWLDSIPAAFVLPDTLAAIESGWPVQQRLFDTQGNGLEELRQKLKQS
jgi:hypothetical protein